MGYRALLIYVALGDPELHIERVRLRVAQGGHNVADSDVRRRYRRSLLHAPEAMQLADEAVVLDNSGAEPERMLLLKGGEVIWCATVAARWVRELTLRVK